MILWGYLISFNIREAARGVLSRLNEDQLDQYAKNAILEAIMAAIKKYDELRRSGELD